MPGPQLFRIQSAINFPDQFLRHFNNEGELSQFDPTKADDFRFDLGTPSADFIDPTGQPKPTVRFKATNPNLTGKFLRHKNFRLLLEAPAPGEEAQFVLDSTFIVEFGLRPTNDKPRTSLVSYHTINPNFPTRYIRHIDFHFFVDEITDQNGQQIEQTCQDATFLLIPPP